MKIERQIVEDLKKLQEHCIDTPCDHCLFSDNNGDICMFASLLTGGKLPCKLSIEVLEKYVKD